MSILFQASAGGLTKLAFQVTDTVLQARDIGQHQGYLALDFAGGFTHLNVFQYRLHGLDRQHQHVG